MAYDIAKIRADFPLLNSKVYGKELVYLDSGATAQKPLSVIEKVDYLHRHLNANIHRGLHYMSEECTSAYEVAREEVRRLIGAASTREVVFTAGATASINTVAYSFGEKFIHAGDNVITTEFIRTVFNLQELMTDETLCVTQASNVLGTCPDLKAIIEVAHAAGVPVLVDGCQGIVHGGVDVQALDCDFYAFSGHKLYGPTGVGVLYGKEHWLEEMPPFFGGGDMVATVSFAGTTYAELPLKFEAGTSNYIAAIGLGEAIRYLDTLDPKEVMRHEQQLLEYATKKLQGIDGLRIYGNQPDKCGIVSFTIDGTHPMDVGMILDKMGIAVRTGTHCAEPVMTHYGITSMVRASFALYNDFTDIDRLEAGVQRAARMLRA